jgi:hypothetical protein
VLEADRPAVLGQRHRPLDLVLQLAHVARKRVGLQAARSLLGQGLSLYLSATYRLLLA